MVAFSDLPKLTCVRMTDVSTVHNGSGTCSKCDSMKLNRAATVTLRESPSWALCSRACVPSDFHRVAMRTMRSSRCTGLRHAPWEPEAGSSYRDSSRKPRALRHDPPDGARAASALRAAAEATIDVEGSTRLRPGGGHD